MKTFLLFFFVLTVGCTRHYYEHDEVEPDSLSKEARVLKFEEILKAAKPGDPISVVLYDDTRIAGSFYSYADRLLSIQVGSTFRDLEISDVRSMTFKSEDKQVKTVLYVLIGISVVFIVLQFLNR